MQFESDFFFKCAWRSIDLKTRSREILLCANSASGNGARHRSADISDRFTMNFLARILLMPLARSYCEVPERDSPNTTRFK
jgi:hypothetical protein